MLNRKWIFVFVQFLLIASINANEDGFEDEEEDVTPVVEEKEEFQPSLFVAPKLAEKSSANFFDYFPVGAKVGQTWIKSLAKKDGVDSDIAKYNGEWSIGPPTKVSIEGDHGLIVKTKVS